MPQLQGSFCDAPSYKVKSCIQVLLLPMSGGSNKSKYSEPRLPRTQRCLPVGRRTPAHMRVKMGQQHLP